MLEVGDRIGDYKIVARLKSGGMATLFLAQRRGAAGFQRFVALKIVHPHLAGDATFVRMFHDEAQLSARIVHPNVVHVEDLGEAEGTYFLVMEYVHGCSLALLERALAKRRRMLAPDIAVAIAMRVADGLHAAHEVRGDKGELLSVVHRDVSPQNVLIAYAGHVKLIDFGIAKARGRSQETEAGSIKGKFRYMSPEQAWGREVDRRSDVFSLGIVLWEMLCARPLFEAKNDVLVIDKVRNPVVEPPSKYAPSVTPALDAVVLAALATEPAQRPATAAELRRRLGEAFPAALSVDEDRLSDLMVVAMSEQIERDRNALPESVVLRLDGFTRLSDRTPAPGGKEPTSGITEVPTQPAHEPPADADEVLKTMTVEAAEIHVEDFDVSVAEEDASPQSVARSVKLDRARDRQRGVPRGVLLGLGALAVLVVVGVVVIGLTSHGSPPPRRTAPPPHLATPPPVVVAPPPLPPPTPPVVAVVPDAGTAAIPPAVDVSHHHHHTKNGDHAGGAGGPVLMQDDF